MEAAVIPSPPGGERYTLSLYVVGTTASSARAIVNVRQLLERHRPGRYALRVIDLSLDRAAAAAADIVAAPTLIRELPPPVRRFVGDMSDERRILDRLDA